MKTRMKTAKFNVSLPVLIFKEGKYFVAHTPALNLSTQGNSFDEVKERFGEIVEIFFEELLKKGTLEEVLSDLGWKKVDKLWSPPIPVASELENVEVPLPV